MWQDVHGRPSATRAAALSHEALMSGSITLADD
jgi:hypothetical protein